MLPSYCKVAYLKWSVIQNRPVACKQKYFNEKLITRDVTTGCVVAGEIVQSDFLGHVVGRVTVVSVSR